MMVMVGNDSGDRDVGGEKTMKPWFVLADVVGEYEDS